MAKKTGTVGSLGFTTPSDPSAVRARKNMDMDVRKLEAARRVLGTRTDTETVDQALDLVTFHGEVFAALGRLAAAGGLEDVFGEVAPTRRGARRITR